VLPVLGESHDTRQWVSQIEACVGTKGDLPVYYTVDIALSAFLQPEFIQKYIKKGRFYALSNANTAHIDKGIS
jgi:hypothetical protein